MSKMYFLPLRPAFDSAGITVPGSQHWFTLAGTNTPSAPFTDATLTTPLENPVIANGIGYLPPIYMDETVDYRVRIYLPHAEVGVDTPTEEYDPYTPAAAILTYLGDSGFEGLLKDAPSLIVPTGTDIISTSGADVVDHGGANYVAGTAPTSRSGFTSSNARNFVLSKEQVITPQMFYQATDPDFQNAMVAARDYLSTFTYNNGSAFYNGAPTLMCPAGSYTMHERVDFTHTGIIAGEGDGWFGPGSGGVTRFKWTAGAGGFGVQAADTSGITTVDSPIHDGSGGLILRDMCLEGYFTTTESETHGLVLRNAVKATDLYLKSWPGEGVKAWAGTVGGFGNVHGNLSTARFIGVKTEGCRGGFDIRGSDANVITTINCEGYQNRWFSLFDDNGAGSNTHIGFHAASGGVVFGTWAQTQCSYGGNYYALKWGGDPTVAPSGTTADTANWLYITAGAPIPSLIPAWVNTPNTFRAGGEYLNINGGALFLNCYSETGGFSQFGTTTTIADGTMTEQYFRGGNRLNSSSSYGYRSVQSPDAAFTLQHRSTQGSFNVQDELGVVHSSMSFSKTSGNFYKARDANGHVFQTAPYNGASTTRASITINGLELPASHAVLVNSLQVVGARQTGWAADTGTAKKTATATYAVGSALTAGAAYVQAEATAVITRQAIIEAALRDATQEIKALKDALIAHGLVGT